MRKNQKYTQDEMYLAIDLWKEGGLTQKKYCSQNHISFNTFKYWLKKYQKDKIDQKLKSSHSFIPVHMPHAIEAALPLIEPECITVTYPNGTKVNCPVSISIEQLRTLINL